MQKIKNRVLPACILAAVGLLGICMAILPFFSGFASGSGNLSQPTIQIILLVLSLTLIAASILIIFYCASSSCDKNMDGNLLKDVLLADSLGAFEINLTKNSITRIAVDNDKKALKNFFSEMNFSLPCNYTEFLEKCKKNCESSYAEKYDTVSCENAVKNFDSTKNYLIEAWYNLPGGKYIFIKSIFMLSRNEKTKDIMGLVVNKDLTERKIEEERKELEIFYANFIDPITGGWNKTFFDIQAVRSIRANPPKSFSLITLDIAGFAIINDMYGLEFGNKLLKHIYKVISQSQRSDELYCRHANDVFNILIRSKTNEELEKHLLGIYEKIKEVEITGKNSDAKENNTLYLDIKMGVIDIDDATESILTIRDKANIAKKSANAKKINPHLTIGYYEGYDLLLKEKEGKISSKMEKALKNGEFEAWLQPKLDLKTKKISGAEALVRWNDKDEGLIPPMEFIPVMEKNGFVTQVDYAIFEQVCKFLRKIMDEGYEPIRISSNFSRLHLKNKNFINDLVEICGKYDVPTKYLELEITETAIFDDISTVTEATKKAHEAGFLCSIDDFGSGYSSLNMLTELPFDIIKLDKSFFGEINELSKNRQYVIKSMVELGQNLGMHIIIEGVETQEQLHFLCDIGCDNAQGYVLSKPIRMKEFEEKYIKTNFQWKD